MKTNWKRRTLKRIAGGFYETVRVMIEEYRHIFRDPGVLIIFLVASLLYPLMYCSIYKNETLRDVPIAVVDESNTSSSRELLRKIDATPELKISAGCLSMKEARNAFDMRKVHGIVFIPEDYSDKINHNTQATVSMYSDMSSFLYYRAMLTACNYAVMEQGDDIQIERLNSQGITGESANIAASPLPGTSTILFNEGAGFASFLMPAIMILIIHQTLFFGINMLAGTTREENRFHLLIPPGGKRKLHQLILGRAATYFSLYAVLSAYILGVIPRLFGLPHIGAFTDIIWFIIPFLLATIFFSMTVSIFIRNRETGMVVFLFVSLILLFLSGFSWPRSNISPFWIAFSWLFPSTPGIQAYIKVNTMGADLSMISKEYIGLWIQAGVYFLTTIFVYRWQIAGSHKRSAGIAHQKLKTLIVKHDPAERTES